MKKALFLLTVLAFLAGQTKSQTPGVVLSNTKISATPATLGVQTIWKDFGTAMTLVSDLDGDGTKELAVCSYFDGNSYVQLLRLNANGTIKPSYTILGKDSGGIVNYQSTDFSTFGYSLANMGDMNGNGVDELAVGSFVSNEFFVLFLNASGKVDSFKQIGPSRGNFPVISPASKYLAGGMANIGDLDHDGVNDLAISDPGYNNFKGMLWIVFLKPNGTVKNAVQIKENTNGLNFSLAADDHLGADVAGIGDLDKDGNPDIMVTGRTVAGGGKGDAFTLFMNSDGTVKSYYHYVPGTAGWTDTLSSVGTLFGEGISPIGDIDGDSVMDVAIGEGAYMDSLGTKYGRVHIWMLNSNGTIKATTKIDRYHGNFTAPLRNNDNFGFGLARGGDLNGDGKKDLIVGARYDDDANPASTGRNSGAVYILYLDGIGSPPVQNAAGDLIYNRTDSYYAYPNPTSDRLVIRPRDKNNVIDKVELYDLSGKKLQIVPVSSSVATLQVSELSAGNYLIAVSGKSGIQTIQFVKR